MNYCPDKDFNWPESIKTQQMEIEKVEPKKEYADLNCNFAAFYKVTTNLRDNVTKGTFNIGATILIKDECKFLINYYFWGPRGPSEDSNEAKKFYENKSNEIAKAIFQNTKYVPEFPPVKNEKINSKEEFTEWCKQIQ